MHLAIFKYSVLTKRNNIITRKLCLLLTAAKDQLFHKSVPQGTFLKLISGLKLRTLDPCFRLLWRREVLGWVGLLSNYTFTLL